ncbi:hypothetical protein GW17_00037462 [Ensete ventricosum]|nr:hypothetical protein GW17_00037462 [Ensete ventricosum]
MGGRAGKPTAVVFAGGRDSCGSVPVTVLSRSPPSSFDRYPLPPPDGPLALYTETRAKKGRLIVLVMASQQQLVLEIVSDDYCITLLPVVTYLLLVRIPWCGGHVSGRVTTRYHDGGSPLVGRAAESLGGRNDRATHPLHARREMMLQLRRGSSGIEGQAVAGDAPTSPFPGVPESRNCPLLAAWFRASHEMLSDRPRNVPRRETGRQLWGRPPPNWP